MNQNMFSESSNATPASFIRAILKTTEADDMISFAGGLPNPVSFPADELKVSSARIIDTYGSKVFQYAQTAGLILLRQYVADRLKITQGMDVTADEIIITTGSQQALDLIGKVFINKGDHVVLEEPSYLGAIQAFSQYRPDFLTVTLENDGMDLNKLAAILAKHNSENCDCNGVKFIYTVPNFQNPTGLSYSDEKRKELLELVHKYDVVLVEDDPYGDLAFNGCPKGFIQKADATNGILLGTFSKTVTPGVRLGYMIIKNPDIRLRINTAKEAADLHSNIFSQYLLYDYLTNNDLDKHIVKIRDLYKEQCGAMISAMEEYFPETVSFTRPTGGMFIWATLPEGMSSLKLFDKASKEKVVFVPGNPFYTDGREANTMRLNYTNSDCDTITEGIRRIASLL